MVYSALAGGGWVHADSSVGECAASVQECAPHFLFVPEKKTGRARSKRKGPFIKTPFQYDRLSWARSPPAAPHLWCSYYARAAVVTLHQTSFGTWGTGVRFSLAWPLTWALAERWGKRCRSGGLLKCPRKRSKAGSGGEAETSSQSSNKFSTQRRKCGASIIQFPSE